MRRNKLALYVHLVWATWDRLPLITPDIERALFRNIGSTVRRMDCVVLAANGTPDHVHLLVRIPSTVTIANLAKRVKGASSRFVNECLKPEFFKWQGTYGAFTVSRWDLERVIRYVKNQKEHHATHQLFDEWEATFEVVDLPAD